MTTRTRLTLQAHDGHALGAYCHEPAREARAVIVIAPAIAVPQAFYAAYASFLAGQGYRVWTFDYRGIGESRQGPLRACDADIGDWVKLDYDAVVQHAAAPALPLFLLGHSMGGQTVPLLPSLAKASGIINIAVGSGARRHNQPAVRRSTLLLWHVLTPLLCGLFGYFPGARLGVVGDLPRGVMRQWRRWCLSPDYLLSGDPDGRAAYARARCPVLGLTFSDDELLLESGSKMLHDAYTGAPVDYRVLRPQQFGLARIGHFGFFRSQQEKILWPLVSDWLEERCAELAEAQPA
ncbi:alpha/beta fold hydrolase [Janthinobacterium sp.]|uniref:alpha/beta hydrolase family protein n=1 Tax=Janthinobacterium sp. TaxID=1871054 RepID=UPI00293D1F57|nr:alpha/beta fold hydrolase [Janthinobacterium sp.]